MINSRDSYNNETNSKEIIEIPYSIGTVVELKKNTSILAKICEYKITEQETIVGLSQAIDTLEANQEIGDRELIFEMPKKFIAIDFTDSIDLEISVKELEENWQKTNKIAIGTINSDKYINFSQMSHTKKRWVSRFFLGEKYFFWWISVLKIFFLVL